MSSIETVCRMLHNELDEIADKGVLNYRTLDYLDKILESIKNIEKIKKLRQSNE